MEILLLFSVFFRENDDRYMNILGLKSGDDIFSPRDSSLLTNR